MVAKNESPLSVEQIRDYGHYEINQKQQLRHQQLDNRENMEISVTNGVGSLHEFFDKEMDFSVTLLNKHKTTL